MMPEKNLEANINYVESNKEKLLNDYANKFLLIHDEKIEGSFDTYNAAADEGIRLFGTGGAFLVHQMSDQEPVNFIMEAAL